MTTNTTRATKNAANVNDASRDAYAAKAGKFANGTTLISGSAAKASISRIEKHTQDINDYAGFAVYNAAVHNNFDPIKRLFAAFVGVKGNLVGEGKTLRTFITKMTTGIEVSEAGEVTRKKSGREGQKVEVPVTFRVLVDNQRKAGEVDSGFVMTYMAFRKQVKDNIAASKKRESIAGTKAGELADGQPDGTEQAPTPTVDSKSGAAPMPFGAVVDKLAELEDMIQTGPAYSEKAATDALHNLAALEKMIKARMEAEREVAAEMAAIKQMEDDGMLSNSEAAAKRNELAKAG